MQKQSNYFPFFSFKGTYYQIGEKYGESCRDLIHKHLELSLSRIENKMGKNVAKEFKSYVLVYRDYVKRYLRNFDEMIQGMCVGANISIEDAYLLQLRAEIYRQLESTNECTTFAILPEATSDGVPMMGQNADLPEFYSSLCVVLECKPIDGPSFLILTPAGQVSYIGINQYGLGCFANFLSCEGWREGFPRYLLSALALMCKNTKDALKSINNVYRASSRNLIMLDRSNNAINLETTATDSEILRPKGGILTHTNHYISTKLIPYEKGEEEYYENSCVRYKRINHLVETNKGKLNKNLMMNILRDRNSHPHNICMMGKDSKTTDSKTVASVIAEPSMKQMWIAMGPPNLYKYKLYTLSQ